MRHGELTFVRICKFRPNLGPIFATLARRVDCGEIQAENKQMARTAGTATLTSSERANILPLRPLLSL